MWQESNYFKTLERSDKIFYTKTLTRTDVKVLPDPYILEKDWEDDVKLLPDLEWPDIYHYLINTPSEFTEGSLKAYKSLEAYNFLSADMCKMFTIRWKKTRSSAS